MSHRPTITAGDFLERILDEGPWETYNKVDDEGELDEQFEDPEAKRLWNVVVASYDEAAEALAAFEAYAAPVGQDMTDWARPGRST